jgi:hypothetical protein
MTGLGLVAAAAVINWFITTVFVESHLFQPIRLWVIHEAMEVATPEGWKKIGNKHFYLWPEGTTQEDVDGATQQPRGNWGKLAQLITCHMCLRVWVGFAEAFILGGPFQGWYSIFANALLYAGLGHLILELRSRVALNLGEPDAH